MTEADGWAAFRVTVRADDEDVATALLWESGTGGIEQLEGPPGESVLIAYFRDDPALDDLLRRRLGALPSARIQTTAIPDVDWVARFREGFHGFACGGFWIAPAWDVPPVTPGGRRLLIVDPGRAFGTGTHETTRLCLRALEEIAPPRHPSERLLDLGTGSGILAVAATLLGWRRVVAADLDPESIDSARRHGHLNGIDLDLALVDGGAAFAPRTFAVALANIAAPLLLERRDELGAVAAPGATIVLSGLLASEESAVRDAYTPLGRVETRLDGEWASLRVHLPR